MNILKSLAGWFGRNAFLFFLILSALVVHMYLGPQFKSHGELKNQVAQLQGGADILERDSRRLTSKTVDVIKTAEGASVGAITRRILASEQERARVQRGVTSNLKALLRDGPDAVVENQQRRVQVALLTREIDSLKALKNSIGARKVGESLPHAVQRHTKVMRDEAATMRKIRTDLTKLQTGATWSRAFNHEEQERLVAAFEASKERAGAATRAAQGLISRHRGLQQSAAQASNSIAQAQRELSRLTSDRSKELRGNLVERAIGWAERVQLGEKAKLAALILVGIILSRYLIRTLFYYVLAPVAQRRPPVRLLPPRQAAGALTTPSPSATSLSLRLHPGEELLVRQGYLQSSSAGGTKATRWLLDYRHPLSSLAAGLAFLTRVRGGHENLTTISAVEDPFAEVALLALAGSASCVLQPRALVAVVQPLDQSLRVTSHWRLTSLNAWLTLQLRFLVFHGPAQLVLRGGRGVRVERAQNGRIFGQEQLIGFNADLAYSVVRAETFAPYLFGRESLLKDQVAGEKGVLILEEAPMAGRGRKSGPRGLEGIFDGLLKAVGI